MLFYPIHPAVRNAHRPPYGYTMYGNIPFRDLVRGPILKDTLAVYARYAPGARPTLAVCAPCHYLQGVSLEGTRLNL